MPSQIERGGLRIGDETVGASASCVDLKEVAGAAVAVGVEDDADVSSVSVPPLRPMVYVRDA